MGQGPLDTAAPAGVTRAQTAAGVVRGGQHELYLAVAQIVADGTPIAAGYRSTKQFLQDTLRVNAAEAQKLIDRAALLTPRTVMTGEQLPPKLAATAAASARGVLNEGHVGVIVGTMERLETVPGIDPDALDAAEHALVHCAGTLAPAGLEKVAHRLIATLDPDGVAPEDAPEPDDELQVLRRRNGTLAFKGEIRGVADVDAIVEAFDALSTPAGPDDTRTQAQRFADVLKELVAQALSPTGIATDAARTGEPEVDEPEFELDDADDADDADDGPGSREAIDLDQREAAATDALDDLPHPATATKRSAACPKVTVSGRALLTVTIDHRWLQAQIGHGLLDSDRTVDPATARRLACDAGVVPMVLGSRGEPLDVGRLSYTVPEGMRRALHFRDGGCSFPGCTRRPRRCHAHHIRHWVDNGETKLDNLTLLCLHHHRMIHRSEWVIIMIDGRPWYRPPQWVDAQQRLRPGGRFPVLIPA